MSVFRPTLQSSVFDPLEWASACAGQPAPGQHTAEVMRIRIHARNDDGSGRMEFVFRVTSGDDTDCLMFVHNRNPFDLAMLSLAVGQYEPFEDTDVLLGRELLLTVSADDPEDVSYAPVGSV